MLTAQRQTLPGALSPLALSSVSIVVGFIGSSSLSLVINDESLCVFLTDSALVIPPLPHRKLGTHVTFVQSCKLDSWSSATIDSVVAIGGNTKVNSVYEAQLPSVNNSVDFQLPTIGVHTNSMEILAPNSSSLQDDSRSVSLQRHNSEDHRGIGHQSIDCKPHPDASMVERRAFVYSKYVLGSWKLDGKG